MEFALQNHCLSRRSFGFSGKGIGGYIASVPYRISSPAAATVAVVARAGSSSWSSHCEPSNGSLNVLPIEPRSAAGKFLKDVFQNQRQMFHLAVSEELKLLAGERNAALDRLARTSGSDEAVLHRRIVEVKQHECQIAAEDVMYMLILHKFSEIRVPLLPKLSKCVYNGRLQTFPPKDFELESIHTPDVLEMIKEHVSTTLGLKSDSRSITDSCATAEVLESQLGQMYASSILYGYFLKSASVRHGLDQSWRSMRHPQCCNNLLFGSENRVLRPQTPTRRSLRSYVMGFDGESLQRCARVRSEEAVSLVERRRCGVFEDRNEDRNGNEISIVASLSSLRRLVLEAVAFGRFLWDSEEYVDSVFKLEW